MVRTRNIVVKGASLGLESVTMSTSPYKSLAVADLVVCQQQVTLPVLGSRKARAAQPKGGVVETRAIAGLDVRKDSVNAETQTLLP